MHFRVDVGTTVLCVLSIYWPVANRRIRVYSHRAVLGSSGVDSHTVTMQVIYTELCSRDISYVSATHPTN